MQHPSFGGMGNPELNHPPTQQIGTTWHRSQSDEMECAGYAGSCETEEAWSAPEWDE